MGAAECQWCGASLVVPPLPASESPETTAYRSLDFSGPPSSGGRSAPGITGPRIGAIIAVAVVTVILLGIVIAALTFSPSSTTLPGLPGSGGGSVDVTGVTVSSPDDACGLNGVTSPAFASPNLPAGIGWGLPANGASYPCTVNNVTTDTPGFIVYANLPLTVTAENTILIVDLQYPTSYHGSLHLIFY